jgi:DnaJ like chaperone protein
MSFIGRLVANARELTFGEPLGDLLVRAARHIPSWLHYGDVVHGEGDPRRPVAFTIAVIALGAKMAKVDGDVTRDEVTAFREVFQVSPGEEDHLRMVFDLARKSTAGFETYARQIGRLFTQDRVVLEHLLGGLFHIALSDGGFCSAEDAYLREVARQFGFNAADYRRIRALHIGVDEGPGDDPYGILGIPPGSSADIVRAAYHRLVRETHPDLAIAQGLPPECVSLTTTRLARINAAYAQIAGGPRPE